MESRIIVCQLRITDVLYTFQNFVVSYKWRWFSFNEFLIMEIIVIANFAPQKFMLKGEHGDYIFLNDGDGTVKTSSNTNNFVIFYNRIDHKILDVSDGTIIEGVDLVVNLLHPSFGL